MKVSEHSNKQKSIMGPLVRENSTNCSAATPSVFPFGVSEVVTRGWHGWIFLQVFNQFRNAFTWILFEGLMLQMSVFIPAGPMKPLLQRTMKKQWRQVACSSCQNKDLSKLDLFTWSCNRYVKTCYKISSILIALFPQNHRLLEALLMKFASHTLKLWCNNGI